MTYRYWDSNVFLGLLHGESDIVGKCRPVIEAARNESIQVVTSALTLTEVLWLKDQPRISANHASEVESFFRNRWIVVRDLDRLVAEQARALVWGFNVKPKDAVHLATALDLGDAIEQFDTFDKDLIKRSGMLGEPPLVIGQPNLPVRLPFGGSGLP